MALIDAHVLAAARLHGDDTTVPVLAKRQTITGRVWTYVRDDRPFAKPAPPAAMYSLITTAKLNDVDPRAWLTDVLARIADHPASRPHELLPRNWKAAHANPAAEAA
jgi:hypothetical protein